MPIIKVGTDDYYPFGLTFNSSERSGYTSNLNLYQSKEWQQDLGLDTYDFHARMYDPVLGRTFQQDPHAENYYDWSPYSWAGGNPILMVDPTGMDWYETYDDDGNVTSSMWREGSDEVDGYTNKGAKYTMNIGNGVSVGFNQNEATSMTFMNAGTGDWESQMNADGTAGNCYSACDQMVSNTGSETAGKANETLVANHDSNGVVTTANGNQNAGQKTMDQTIEN